MNFGQALAALLNGRSISNSEWQRPGMSLAMQERTGMVTEPFIVQSFANGVTQVWTPSQADILSNNWMLAGEGKIAATQGETQNMAEARQGEARTQHAGMLS